MNDQIPSDWTVKPLEDICSWVGVGIATSTTHAYTAFGIPILRNQNILPNSIRDSDMLHITEEFSNENGSKKLRAGDLISIRTGYPGVTAVVPERYDGCHSFTTLISRPNSEKIYSFYLSFLINSDYGRKFVLGGQAGGAQQNLNVSVLKQFPVIIPPLPEQQKIAAILTSVDEVIEKTQAQIDKLKDLKTAMMQELLTNGVGIKQGDAYIPHTEFKDSPVGRIPKSWDCVNFGDITLEHKQGYYSKERYTPNGTYIVRITDMSNPTVSFTVMPRMVISDNDFNSYKLDKGDFIFARSGAIGRYGIYDSENEAVFASYLIRFKFDQTRCLNQFLGYCYESSSCQKQLGAITQGSSNININALNIKSLVIPIPTIDEQERIVNTIGSIDKRANILLCKLVKLKSTKKALMQDLLTGKVRVKVER
jgi:type I restriction enzyme S subunit